MFRCPECGANMRYDIRKGKLVCDYCDTETVVGEHPQQQKDAKEATYDVSVFTCPQCGGEITSTDNAATDFCPYCGMTVVLDGHLAKERKPDLITPFRISQEDCGTIYQERARKIWCLPKEYADETHVSKAVPIYMPYIVYEGTQTGARTYSAHNQRGNYIYRYKVDAELDNSYTWMLRDASSVFYDKLSDGISDYTKEACEPFQTGYLAGFYADNGDVKEDVYKKDITKQIEEREAEYLEENIRDKDGHSLHEFKERKPRNQSQAQTPDPGKTPEPTYKQSIIAKKALLPVWFLTWQRDDRVAYFTMNGETGTCAGNFPVDIKKYGIWSLVFAIPFFFLFLPFLTFTPRDILLVSIPVSMLVLIITGSMVTRQINNDRHYEDKGFYSGKKETPYSNAGLNTISIVIMVLVCLLAWRFIGAAALIISFFYWRRFRMLIEAKGTERFVLYFVPFLTVGSLIQLINPADDIWHYAGIIAVMFGCCVEFLFMIRHYNLSCMLPIPVYHERGTK